MVNSVIDKLQEKVCEAGEFEREQPQATREQLLENCITQLQNELI